MANKKYFWLKLKKDFFKRHDIRIIEALPNGKDYILFYLKLLLESVDHEGKLRFSDTIPYNAEMLAIVTNTNVDVVKSALNNFQQLNMIEVLDDETIYMMEVEKMIGSYANDEHTRETTRLRVQKHREEQKRLAQSDPPSVPERYSNVTCNGELDIELEIEKEKDKDKEIKKRVTTLDIFEKLKEEHFEPLDLISVPLIEMLETWLRYKSERKEPYKEIGLKNLIKQIYKAECEYGYQEVCRVIEKTMGSNYKGIVWDWLIKVKKPTATDSMGTYDAVSDWLSQRGE